MNGTIIPSPIETHNAALDQVEALMDKWTVGGILDLMAEVASTKADHLRSNWQDESAARLWELMVAELLRAQQKILKLRLP